MCKYRRNLDFTLMITLILIEFASITISFFNLFDVFQYNSKDELNKENYFYNYIPCVISIGISLLSIWILFVLGIQSLYFKIIQRLFFYILG